MTSSGNPPQQVQQVQQVQPTQVANALNPLLHGEVRVDPGTRAAYASDASNHRVRPTAVVYPKTVEDVVQVVQWCAAEGVPITSRGAGTGIAGSALGTGVVIDHSKHLGDLLAVDPETRQATVQPGLVLEKLQRSLQGSGLRFGPDPSSQSRCTLGGMIGTNACGSHSVAWGSTADSVLDLKVALADGTVTWLSQAPRAVADRVADLADAREAEIAGQLGRFPRQISGYGLHRLPDLAKAFVGSEGTLGVVVSARLGLVRLPERRVTVLAAYADIVAAAAASAELADLVVLTCEALDAGVVAAYDERRIPGGRPELPPGGAWLLIDVDEALVSPQLIAQAGLGTGAISAEVVADQRRARALWSIRERGAGLASRLPDGAMAWPGWEDAAVPVANLGPYLTDFLSLMQETGRRGVIYGHFGEGCVHVRIDHDLSSSTGQAAYRRFLDEACRLVIDHGGVPSGEHGDGRARSELLPRVYGPSLAQAFADFKEIWDPNGLFNPGIIVDPAPLDADLRMAIARPHTSGLGFAYPEDQGDFGQAVNRCTGVGACRKETGGGMCPSWRASGEETYSTRGRARLLAEMLDGSLQADSWQSAEVLSALEACLACKACASECPVGVDMATYKAEFLYQHYRGKRRPALHYTLGRLPLLLRQARRRPRVANKLLGLQNVPGAKLVARLAGVDASKPMPRLAERTPSVSDWAAAGRVPGGEPVTLWLDTFTTAFLPDVVDDAIRVLIAAGFDVRPVGLDECCGLTLITTGQLAEARQEVARTLSVLSRSMGPVIVLEPSCAAALKHDAPRLMTGPEGLAAREVADRVQTLAQVIWPAVQDGRLDFAPLTEKTEWVAQFHCHQRAVLGTDADVALLAHLGVDLTNVDEGCCGQAGDFGYAQPELAQRVAEGALIPALTQQPNAGVLADGFSCKVQVGYVDGRAATHLATLLARALR